MTTDSTGKFQFRGLAPGRKNVVAIARNASARVSVRLGLHDRREVVLLADEAFTVAGKVAATGAIPKDIVVQVKETRGHGARPTHSAELAADGAFSIAGVERGTHFVRANAKGAPLFVAGSAVEIEVNQDIDDLVIPLGELYSIGVVARQSDGSPAVAVSVRATLKNSRGLSSTGCKTDRDGRCKLLGLTSGTLGFRSPGKLTKTLPNDDGAEVEFEVPAGPTDAHPRPSTPSSRWRRGVLPPVAPPNRGRSVKEREAAARASAPVPGRRQTSR